MSVYQLQVRDGNEIRANIRWRSAVCAVEAFDSFQFRRSDAIAARGAVNHSAAAIPLRDCPSLPIVRILRRNRPVSIRV